MHSGSLKTNVQNSQISPQPAWFDVLMCCVGARRRDERSRYKCLSGDHKCHHLQQFLLRAAAARLVIRTLLLLPPAATLRHLWSACSQPHESLQATAKTLPKWSTEPQKAVRSVAKLLGTMSWYAESCWIVCAAPRSAARPRSRVRPWRSSWV